MSPRTCTICSHAARDAIDSALVDRRVSYRNIAERFSVSQASLSRHFNEHLAEDVQKALSERGIERGVKALDKVTNLITRLDAFLDSAEASRELREFVVVAAEMRKQLELVAKLQGELQQEGTTNIWLDPEWLQIEAVLVATLEGFPDAREAVVRALKELPNGHG